jgi:hypothetical protein
MFSQINLSRRPADNPSLARHCGTGPPMRPAGVRIFDRAHGRRAARAEGRANGSERNNGTDRHGPCQREDQRPGECRQGPVVMMCARRICGCTLRSSNLVRLILVAFAVIVLAGGTATAIQDVLDAILIAASVLVAAIVAFFAIQVHVSRKQTIQESRPVRPQPTRPRPLPPVTAPRPAPAVAAPPHKAAQAPADSPGRHARQREGGPGELADSRAPDGGTRLSVPS